MTDLGFPSTQYLGHSMQKKALYHSYGCIPDGWVAEITPANWSCWGVKVIMYDSHGFTHPDLGGGRAYYIGGRAEPNYPVPALPLRDLKSITLEHILGKTRGE